MIDGAGAGRLVARSAAGLDTQLETGGRSLSAGEAQLLALARVFLRNPGLVILDEASSRLDPATEQRIERAIDRLLHDRTAIVIAHRLGTVQRAGEILILERWPDLRIWAARAAGRRPWLALLPAAANRAGRGAGMSDAERRHNKRARK